MIKNCCYCGKVFTVTKDMIKFCSKECKGLKRAQRILRYAKDKREKIGKVEHSKLCYSSNIKSRYGITLHEYRELMSSTGGLCFLCGKKPSYKLVLDHNHTTGKVRKPLCNKCNMVVGIVETSPLLIDKAVGYIAKFGL